MPYPRKPWPVRAQTVLKKFHKKKPFTTQDRLTALLRDVLSKKKGGHRRVWQALQPKAPVARLLVSCKLFHF